MTMCDDLARATEAQDGKKKRSLEVPYIVFVLVFLRGRVFVFPLKKRKGSNKWGDVPCSHQISESALSFDSPMWDADIFCIIRLMAQTLCYDLASREGEGRKKSESGLSKKVLDRRAVKPGKMRTSSTLGFA